MKKIKELSTAKKIWLTIVLIPVVIVGAFLFRSHVAYPVAAKIYLANKYSWNYFSIKTEIFVVPLTTYIFDFEGGSGWYSANPCGIFEYNGREFYVECMKYDKIERKYGTPKYQRRTKLYFADDYQLTDIFQWCTEYLQENVDKGIAGVQIDSDIIYHSTEHNFDYELPWTPKKVFTKEDAKELLKMLEKADTASIAFYQVDDLNIYRTKTKYLLQDGYYYKANDKGEELKNKEKNKLKQAGFNQTNILLIEKPQFEIGYVGLSTFGKQRRMSIDTKKIDYV